MRKVLPILVGFAVVTAGLCVPVSGDARGEPVGRIHGLLRDAHQHSRGALAAQVRNVATGDIAATQSIDTAGRFDFSGLHPGSYIVEVVESGSRIIAASSPVAVVAGKTSAIAVTTAASDAAASSPGAGGNSGRGGGVLLVTGAAAAVGITGMVVTRGGKVVLCHKPTKPAQTIEVSESAKDAHLAHGDTLGACPLSQTR